MSERAREQSDPGTLSAALLPLSQGLGLRCDLYFVTSTPHLSLVTSSVSVSSFEHSLQPASRLRGSL